MSAVLKSFTKKLDYVDTSDFSSVDATVALERLAETEESQIIVIGSGPVGMRFVEEVLKHKPSATISVFGNEPVAPYNRVQLSALLAGQVTREQINLPLPDKASHHNFSFQVASITEISRDTKTVVDSLGKTHHYGVLVIATGARAHIPNMPGNDKKGVYRFRNLADTEALFARITRCRHVVVLGGGLLGLEAAKALHRSGTNVTLIQQGPHLMNRQLDRHAATLLQTEIEQLGINVVAHAGAREILGKEAVEAIRTHDDRYIKCDTVLVCAGIKANKEVALNAKLAVGAGITVDDELRTSDPNIFAIGECCEHEGKTYGLVNPGFEQAAVAASVICGKAAQYQGSMAITRLKVVGQDVCSMGDVVELGNRPLLSEIEYRNKRKNIYRKLVLLKGRVIGALGYGEWPESSRIQSLFQNQFYVWPWQRLLFRFVGGLWFNGNSGDLKQWPDKTVVCNCKNVSKGEITAAILALEKGAASTCPVSLESVQKSCGASTVCGSCKPQVMELLDSDKSLSSEKAWKTLLGSCIAAVLIALIYLFTPELSVSRSVQSTGWFEKIWNDKFWKQVSGFSLLGMTLVGLLMSLRKRFNFAWMGQFAYWRIAHSVLGVACAVLLIFHTGFHMGSNLNQILLINFLALLLLGSTAGAMISLSHKLKPAQARNFRNVWTWMHVLVSWPLPALLAAHILSVYYF